MGFCKREHALSNMYVSETFISEGVYESTFKTKKKTLLVHFVPPYKYDIINHV